MSREYLKYKYLKKKFKATFKGYSLNKILAKDLIFDCYKHSVIEKPSFKRIIRDFIYIDNYKCLDKLFNEKAILISHSMWKRNDYRNLVISVSNNLSKPYVFDFEFEKRKRYRVDYIFTSLIQVFWYFKKDFSIRQLLHLSTILTTIKYRISEIERLINKSNIKGYIAFNSSILDDSILCSVLKRYNIPTFSLQHGYYSIYKESIPLDIVNYENLTADKLLCWGKSTYENMVSYGINSNRLFILGNPEIDFSNGINVRKPSFKKCLVLLGRNIYHNSNMELITDLLLIRDKYNIDFILKLHPSLYSKKLVDEYTGCFPLVGKDLSVKDSIIETKCDFSISHNTSAFFNALMEGLICFKYTNSENEYFGKLPIDFDNVKSFEFQKNRVSGLNKLELEEEVLEILKNNFSEEFKKNISKLELIMK